MPFCRARAAMSFQTAPPHSFAAIPLKKMDRSRENVAEDGSQRNFQVSTLLKKSFLPFLYDQSAPVDFEQAKRKRALVRKHFISFKHVHWISPPMMSTTENTSFRRFWTNFFSFFFPFFRKAIDTASFRATRNFVASSVRFPYD